MTVDSMFEHDGRSGANTTVQSSTLPGQIFAIGDHVFGTLSLNTNVSLSGYQPPIPSSGTYQLYSGGVMAGLQFFENNWQFNSGSDESSSLIQIANNASTFDGWDVFYAGAYAPYSPVTFESMTFNFFDSSGTVFNSSELSALPADFLSLSAFNYANLDYGWLRVADGSQMHASGHLTSLELVNAVPAPATSALLVAGFFAFVFSRKRTFFNWASSR